MAGGFGMGFLDRFRADYLDPALSLLEEANAPRTDSHLNSVSIEYSEDDIRRATRNLDDSLLLGSGSFGSVFKGTMRDGTEVAIKTLKVPDEAGFEEEVQVLSRFRHPNLVILMGFSRHVIGSRSLIYEFLSGGDVSKRLQSSRQGVEGQAFLAKMRLSAALDAASGLSHLHNANPRAFHRDIKGPNILLDKNGTAKMADFGLACVSQSSHHKVRNTSGTVGYACQEYIRTGVVTEGSEVHSFGMVLMELLTGAPPAVQKPDNPNEFCYLVDYLQGSMDKLEQMLDKSGHFPEEMWRPLGTCAFKCIAPNLSERPLFVQLVEHLRHLLGQMPDDSVKSVSGVVAAPQDVSTPQRASLQKQNAAPQVGQHGAAPNGLAVGQALEAKWRNGMSWFRGKIARVNANNTVAVRYDDGDFEENVPLHNIRVLEPPPRQPSPEQHQALQPPQPLQRQQQPPTQQQPQQLPQTQVPQQPLARLQTPARQSVQGAPGQSPQGGDSMAPAQFNASGQWQSGRRASGNVDTAPREVDLPPPPPPAPQRPPAPDDSASAPPKTRVHNIDIMHRPSPPTVVGSPRPQRGHEFAPPGRSEAEPRALPPQCSLRCTYAEGVDISQLRDVQCVVSLPGGSQELVIGRTSQPPQFWDTLIVDPRLRGTVSREHFKIFAKRGPAGQTLFSVVCSSLNGLMLNGDFLRQGCSERELKQGDTIALAASMESTPSNTPQSTSIPRKPFVVFNFELPPGQAQAQPSAEREELLRPPEGTVAGRWRTSDASTSVPDDALFCLEVHGENVRMDLPSEARQLFFCCGADASNPPALRIGKNYQSIFWRKVLQPNFFAGGCWSFVSPDHFEIRSQRRGNPNTREPPNWRFQLRVLSSAGLTVNYGMQCSVGEERDLRQSDTLTVDAPSAAPAASKSGDSVAPLRGLHMTFISYSESFVAPPSPSLGSQIHADDRPKAMLPEDPEEDDGHPGGLLLERSYAGAGALRAPGQLAGALKAPIGFQLPGSSVGMPASRITLPATPSSVAAEAAMPTMHLGSGVDPEDHFSRTGFSTSI